jgi:hypothetical protein
MRSALVLAAAMFGLMGPATASATIHSGSFVFVEPQYGPSLEPEPSAIETKQYVREVSVVYDDQAGSITITAENYDPSHWGSKLGRVLFQLGPKCEENGYEGEEQALVEGSFHGLNEYDELEHSPAEITRGTLTLRGYGGQLEVVGPFNGQTFSITYANPHLVGLELRCATVEGGTIELGGYTPLVTPLRTYRASRTQVRAMEAAANAHHSGGFNRHKHHFLSDRTTSNGWAAASWSIFPHNAQPETIVFDFTRGAWRVITWGSSVCGRGSRVPEPVCRALNL